MAREITTLAVPLVIPNPDRPAVVYPFADAKLKAGLVDVVMFANNRALEFRVDLGGNRAVYQINMQTLVDLALLAIEADLAKPQEGL